MNNTKPSNTKRRVSRGGFSQSHSRNTSFTKRTTSNRSQGRKRKTENINISQFVRAAEPAQETKVFIPKHTFADFGLSPKLVTVIKRRGFTTPSPIQDGAIPASLEGRDVLGVANTGTGKTAAFLLPIINSLIENRNQKALVLAPTRELALQIKKEFQAFTDRDMKLFSCAVVGGAPIGPQMSELRRGVQIIIGTPGRVQDMIKRNLIRLETISHVVLDEVDQMLDMGFVKDITTILHTIPPTAQKYFFSATLAPNVTNLIDGFLTNPVKVLVKTQDTSKNVDQNIVRVQRGEIKIETLKDLLVKEGMVKALVFAETKRSVQNICDQLSGFGLSCGSLHGDKRQRERVRILEDFKRSTITVLVATDVAARGLDVPDISHVINYEIPQTYDTYIHRIGRTGRADKKGIALTFVS